MESFPNRKSTTYPAPSARVDAIGAIVLLFVGSFVVVFTVFGFDAVLVLVLVFVLVAFDLLQVVPIRELLSLMFVCSCWCLFVSG